MRAILSSIHRIHYVNAQTVASLRPEQEQQRSTQHLLMLSSVFELLLIGRLLLLLLLLQRQACGLSRLYLSGVLLGQLPHPVVHGRILQPQVVLILHLDVMHLQQLMNWALPLPHEYVPYKSLFVICKTPVNGGTLQRDVHLPLQVTHALLLVIKVCLGDEDLIRPQQPLTLIPAGQLLMSAHVSLPRLQATPRSAYL